MILNKIDAKLVSEKCNLQTNDAGEMWTDTNQCEGYCIADDVNSNSGKCMEYKQLTD